MNTMCSLRLVGRRRYYAVGAGCILAALRSGHCSEELPVSATTPVTPQAGESLVEFASLPSIAQVAVSLAIVVGAVLLLAGLFRYLTRVQGGVLGGLRVIGGLSVGARERIVLVSVGEKQLLVGVAPGYLRTLHVFDRPPAAGAADPEPDTAFAARLRGALGSEPDNAR